MAFFTIALRSILKSPAAFTTQLFRSTPASHLLTSQTSRFVPSTGNSLAAIQQRGYRTRTALKLRCEHCFFCRRRGKLRVVCNENPRHKQKQK
ncbi:hypothetical protein DFS34DRAFT_629150 [Phlyctochytrium arcticum]|nr:hypothetical protein DFS34DRAFT_629150 [Phlyctochytrium arcticum]